MTNYVEKDKYTLCNYFYCGNGYAIYFRLSKSADGIFDKRYIKACNGFMDTVGDNVYSNAKKQKTLINLKITIACFILPYVIK